MDENRILSEIIKSIHENKCITESDSSTDDETSKWDVGDSEPVGVMNLNIIAILVIILLILA